MDIASIIIGLLVAVPMIYTFMRVVADMRNEKRQRDAIEATRRVEAIDGKEYSVVTKSLPVVRETRTGKMGILLERGAESDPNVVRGEIELQPRWIKVQFIRKSDGKAGKTEWRRFNKFEITGSVDVDFLSCRRGLFNAITYVRYPNVLPS